MTDAYRTASAPPEEPSGQPSPIANLATLFPRPHPSASTVRILGVLALTTGPLAGIPAILLGRVVERECARSNGRITPAPRLFVRLGWAGSTGGACLMVYLVATSSFAMAAGLAAAALVTALSAVAGGGLRRSARRVAYRQIDRTNRADRP